MGAKPQILACYALALALLLFRLAQTGQGPLIADEPRLLNQVDLAQEAGEWPRAGLLGNVGVRYGPVAHYFYRGVQAVSHAAEAPLWANALVCLLAQLLVALAVNLAFGQARAALFLVLAASSPWLYQYSLMPWDSALLFPWSAGAVLALVLATRAGTPGQLGAAGALLGLFLALALGTHPDSAGLATAAAATLLLRGRGRGRETGILVLSAAATALLLLAPYLLSLGSGEIAPGLPNREFPLLPVLGGLFAFLAPGGMSYFLTPQHGEFFAAFGALGSLFAGDPVGWAAKLFTAAGAGALLLGRLGRRAPLSPLHSFALLSLLFCAAELLLAGVPVHPQYFASVWWAPFVLLATSELRFLKPVAAALVAVNVAFTLCYAHFLRERGGTRGDYYGTSFAEQRAFVRSLCAGNESYRVVNLAASTLRADSLVYLFRRLPECAAIAPPQRYTMQGPADLRIGFSGEPPGGAKLVKLPPVE